MYLPTSVCHCAAGCAAPRRTFILDIPAQHAADASLVLIRPDWLPQANMSDPSLASVSLTTATRSVTFWPWSFWLGYRVDSGKYDVNIPEDFLYATTVYFWDGM